MQHPDWTSRLAGALVVSIGVLNVVVGVLSLTTSEVQLSPGIAGGYIAGGLLSVAVGALVWRGSWAATVAAAAACTALLVLQVVQILAIPVEDRPSAAPVPVATLVILVLLIATTGIAAWRIRRQRRAAPRP